MPQHRVFEWQAGAEVFAGSANVARPSAAPAQGFCACPATPLADSLAAVGAAVLAGDPFCVSDPPFDGPPPKAGAFLTLTGGSSGQPKVIRRTQASWIDSFLVNQRLFDLRPGQHAACLGGMAHSLTLYGVLEALHLGLHAHLLGGLPPAAQRAELAQHRITTLYATPAQLRLLTGTKPKTALHDMRHILCGGGMLDEATRHAAQTLFPAAQIHVFYGAAETSFITLSDATTPPGAVGKAYPGVTLDIRAGEVWVKSPYLFQGYASGGTQAAQAPDGFVTAGELGRLDADGTLWLLGRKTRQVQIADQTVCPEEIENFILSETCLSACAVLPVPDTLRGHRLVALLSAAQDHKLIQQVQDLCRCTYGPTVAPRQIFCLAHWPTLASGKTDLAALANWLEEQT